MMFQKEEDSTPVRWTQHKCLQYTAAVEVKEGERKNWKPNHRPSSVHPKVYTIHYYLCDMKNNQQALPHKLLG